MMRMATVKSIGALSLAKIQGIVMAFFGLVIGIFVAALSEIGTVFGGPFFRLGYLAVIGLPIFYGAVGFVFGAVTALMYNAAAKLVGGLEIELDKSR
ncbi:MAG: DUF3566 domain-containing protein [Candidatus Woesearchaeota archaeon]